MKNVYLFITLLVAIGMQAQNLQNANWYFGYQNAFSFSPPNQSSPQQVFGSAMITSESCASVSDLSGNLLFYTNGITVWNSLNVPMTGPILNGDISNTQGAVIVLNPGDVDSYYIFTIDGTGTHKGLYYYKVHISSGIVDTGVVLNFNNGSTPINASFQNTSEKLTVTRHMNGTDFWVVTQIKDKICSYQVTSTGVIANPVKSNAPINTDTKAGSLSAGVGQLKISQNCQRIGVSYKTGFLAIGTFDNATGNAYFTSGVMSTPNSYSLEFSPNSQLFYFNTIINSIPTVAYTSSPTAVIQSFSVLDATTNLTLQRALNDRIYLSSANGYLQVINTPNNVSNPGFDATHIEFNGDTRNLPQWVPAGEEPCASLTLTSEPNTTYIYASKSDISTQTNYVIDPGKNITMKARDYVVLKPNTYIGPNSLYHAKIEMCNSNGGVVGFERHAAPEQAQKETQRFKEGKTFSLMPNPATTKVTVKGFVDMQSVLVTSLDGKTMFNREYRDNSESVELDVSAFAAGYYTVTVITKDGQIQTQKLIKN